MASSRLESLTCFWSRGKHRFTMAGWRTPRDQIARMNDVLGLVVRYMAPHLKQTVAERDYGMLVRGEDRYHHFVSPPATKNRISSPKLSSSTKRFGPNAAVFFTTKQKPSASNHS